MSAQESVIRLCTGVQLNNDYKHTLWFDSLSDQLSYFSGKVSKTFLDYSYLRKNWSIKVDATMSESRTWSYLFFTNPGDNKTYYYFVTDIQYISDDTVELMLELDVMQTYLFDYVLQPCFVEREHADTDEPGDNLVDEGLELGELVVNASQNLAMQDLSIVMLMTFNPARTTEDETVTDYVPHTVKVFSGLDVYAVPVSYASALRTHLHQWDSWGISDGIISMWMYPTKLLTMLQIDDTSFYRVGYGASFDELFNRLDNVDGYVPHNKKLLTYPFNFLYVSNNAGGGAVYHYERFADPEQCAFRVVGSPGAEGGVKLFPVNYKGLIINYDEGMTGASYPTCAWNQDAYKLWLAQNQNQQTYGALMSGVSIVAGAALTAAGAVPVGLGLMAGGASGIGSQLAQRADRAVQPPQARGNYSANVNIEAEHQTFTVQKKSVGFYHAQLIDQFFDMFGYKTNRVKVPNRNVRERYTYTKTNGCIITGSFCVADKTKIQSIYDAGVTFWKHGDLIGAYGLENPITKG